MSALPRPELPPGPHRDLVVELHDLHHRAGWPSLRTLAGETGVSHTTVSKAFSWPTLPSWGTLELVVEAMHGDVAGFHDLWLAASVPTDEGRAPAPRIAGRRTELTAVRRHLETGTGLLLVTGEAGIGKTTLVRAATERSACFVAVGHCLPLATEVPLLPVVDVLTAMHDVEDGRWLEAALEELPAFVVQSLSRLLPHLGDAPSEESDGITRQHLFTSVGTALSRLAALRSVALVLEDLHWADPSTLDLLEHLLRGSTPLPVVATWRTEDPASSPSTLDWLVRAQRTRGAQRLDLGPLDRADSAEQLGLLGVTQAKRLDRIYERSQGQPLFTEQLASHLDDATGLPVVLADLLDRRLDGLGEPAWAVLRTLGVAERPLTPAQVAAASSDSPEGLIAQLRLLRDKRLVRPSSDDLVHLQHPLLAEATQRRLVAGEAAQVHRALAEVLGVAPDASAAEVARHWQSAGDGARELEWRVMAARSSGLAYEWGQEADHWLRALDLWPRWTDAVGEPPVSRPEAYVAAMDALKESLDWDRAADMSEAAETALGEVDDRAQAELLRRAAEYRGERENLVVGRQVIDQALVLFSELEPSAGYVHALDFKRGLLIEFGEYAEAMLLAETTVRTAKAVGDQHLYRHALISLAWHQGLAGTPGRTFDVLAHASSLSRPGADPVGDIRSAVIATDVFLLCGSPVSEVERAARPGLESARSACIDSEARMILTSNLALALLRSGAVAEANAVLGQPDDRPPDPNWWPIDSIKALLDATGGSLDAAAARVRIAADVGPSDEVDLETLCMAADVDFWGGQAHVTMPRLLRELEVVVDTAPVRVVLPALMTAARGAAEVVGVHPARMRTVADVRDLVLRASAHLGADDEASPQVRAHLGTAHAELGRAAHQDPPGAWADAAALWDELARPHDAAYCRWRAAQAALREGQGTVAARLLKKAATDAREHVPLTEAIAATAAGVR